MIIELAENKSKRVEILRAGKFVRRWEDDLEITKLDLEKLKQNFEANARRQELEGKPVVPFNFSHDTWAEAAGWITGLETGKDSNNFDALFAEVDWTKKGAEKIKNNEFKFVSSEFSYNFKDPETGKIFDVILGGAALTNIPFIRDMEAVQLSENRNGQRTVVSLSLSGDNPDFNSDQDKTMIKQFNELSPEKRDEFLLDSGLVKKETHEKLSGELKKSKKDLQEAESKNLKLTEKMTESGDSADKLKLAESKIEDQGKKINSLVSKMAAADKKSEFDAMLSEGKVCEAQRKPFMDGDFIAYAKNAQAVKLDESGSGSQGDEEENDASKKIEKLAEAKMKEDEALSYGDAFSLVLSENRALRNQLGY